MTFKRALLALAVTAGLSAPAHAVIFTFTGDTTNGPTFDRPLESLTGLSAIGTDVNYSVFSFTVDTAGAYTFLTTGEFDTFVILYAGSFNPASPLTNALKANDDLLGITTSGFGQALTTGTVYHYVTTGFDSDEFGAFSTTIGGPGVVTQIPEVGTYLMMGLGLGLIGAVQRRRAQRAQSAAF